MRSDENPRSHFPWKELGYAAGGVCLLLALYVGAYYATVAHRFSVVEDRDFVPLIVRKVAAYPFAETFGADVLQPFFAPIHDIDRRLRTEYWKDEEFRW